MDQSFAKRASRLHGLAALVVVACLLPGCAWFKTQFAGKPAPVPSDPERKAIVDSKAGGKKTGAAVNEPTEKSATANSGGIKLDGSATGNGAPTIPNAPALASTQIPASGLAPDDPSAGLPDTFDTKDSGQTVAGQHPLKREADGSVVVAGSSAGSGRQARTVVTADERDDDDRDDDSSAAVVKPTISKADEALTNENSVFEFEGAGVKLKNGVVAATVNGQPIFLEDIMKQMPVEQVERLAQAEVEAPPEEYRKARRHVLNMYLPQHIERELLLQALKAKLKDDVLKGIQKQIDATFNSEFLPNSVKQAGVTTEAELEQKLLKQGSSIEVLRTQFRNRELGQQYLGAKALPKNGFDRPDILKYYQEHKKKYFIPAQAKWEHIRISYAKNGGKEGASKIADKIIERLENDEDFSAIARECSNGPTASSKGGLRGWTTQGTLKEKEVEQALYAQPVGEIGPPIETQDSFEIIRVIERIPSGYQPFEMVQEDIKSTIKQNLWQKATKALIQDLKEKATIESFIDKL